MAPLILRARAVCTLVLAGFFALQTSAAGDLELIEQKIKAGLLYNFLKYTQWPAERLPSADAPLVVCLLGGDPFGGSLDPMAGRTVNQHVIEVREIPDAAAVGACSLLFVNAAEQSNWPALQSQLAGQSILTVSDFEGFARSGGMIEFIRIDNRIGVEINTDAVSAAQLIVEDRLLRLASAVSPGAPENQ